MSLLTLFLTNLQMGGSPTADVTVTVAKNEGMEVYIRNANGVWEHTQIMFTGTNLGTPE